MDIEDFIPQSLTHWPGKICFVVIVGRRKRTTKELELALHKVWNAEAIVITGEEPTQQNDLAVFCKRFKLKKLLIRIETNGENPAMLQSLIERDVVDYIVLKPASISERVKTSIEVLKNSKISYEIR